MFKLTPKPLPEPDTERMGVLYWKWKNQWEEKYLRMESKREADEPFDVNGPDIFGDVQDWEQFAERNYEDRLPDYSGAMSVVPLLLLLAGRVVG